PDGEEENRKEGRGRESAHQRKGAPILADKRRGPDIPARKGHPGHNHLTTGSSGEQSAVRRRGSRQAAGCYCRTRFSAPTICGLLSALANPGDARALANAGLASALAKPGVASAFAKSALASALAKSADASAFAKSAFANAFAKPGLASAFA